MRILAPAHPLRRGQPDDLVAEEVAALRALDVPVSLFGQDALENGELSARPDLQPGDAVLYRGWMLREDGYRGLAAEVERLGGRLITSVDQYLLCHHLPRWYPACRDLTPETLFFPPDADLSRELAGLDWSGFFVKDHVKSLTTRRGSFARSPAEAAEIAREIATTRGAIEGGLCVRRIEDFVPDTERRVFVRDGHAHAHDGEVPDVAREVARRIASPFFSVDVVRDRTDRWRLVELGDGQVSDRKEWSGARLAEVIAGR